MPGTTHGDKTIVVAAAIDDSYTEQLLVVLWSACRRLSPGWTLRVFVIGYQLSPESKQRLKGGLKDRPVQFEWKTLDLSGPRSFWPGIARDGDITAYYRMFLGEALPETVERVIFLDADVLVEGDLAKLWNSPFEGHTLQAVPDAYGELLHTSRLLRMGVPYPHRARFFNAGVLLIDLGRWRERDVGRKASELLWKYGVRFYGRDQDALNCVLADDWKALPPSWNLHELPHMLFCWDTSGQSSAELRRAFFDPNIIHFVGTWKPWSSKACQGFYERWQAAAREAGFAMKAFPLLERLRQRLIWAPHAELNRRLWREVVQAPNPSQWIRIVVLLLKHPWMFVTYPVWQAWVWAEYSRIRIALHAPQRPGKTPPKAPAKVAAR